MMIHTAVISLFTGSVLVSFMILTAGFFGLQILKHWDLKSGSERQLELEKRTYLISTLVAYAFGFEILSLFLFIYTVDDLHALFVGAMCAAGTLNVNPYGYPTLLLKEISFILAGLWLVMNHADTRGTDYPLIRKKYAFLLLLVPVVLAETVVQGAYFLNLKANVITSCCGSLFGADLIVFNGFMSTIASLPVDLLRGAFYGMFFLTICLGLLFYRGFERLGGIFSVAGVVFYLTSMTALISFICLYFYELPTHHCPFCIMQADYSHVGYLLYGALHGAVISGAGVGMLMPFRSIPSLRVSVPAFQKRLTALTLILYVVFTLIITYQMIRADFILDT